MENNEFKVVNEDKDIITVRWEIFKSETPNHSYIREVDSCFPQRYTQYGPVPDVLIGETLHELKEARRELVQNFVNRLMKGIR